MVNLTFDTKGIDNKYGHDWGVWKQHLEERKSCCCTICAPLHTILLLCPCLPSPGMQKSEAGVSHVNREHWAIHHLSLNPSKGHWHLWGRQLLFQVRLHQPLALWSFCLHKELPLHFSSFQTETEQGLSSHQQNRKNEEHFFFAGTTIWKQKGEPRLFFCDFSCVWCFEQ